MPEETQQQPEPSIANIRKFLLQYGISDLDSVESLAHQITNGSAQVTIIRDVIGPGVDLTLTLFKAMEMVEGGQDLNIADSTITYTDSNNYL